MVELEIKKNEYFNASGTVSRRSGSGQLRSEAMIYIDKQYKYDHAHEHSRMSGLSSYLK